MTDVDSVRVLAEEHDLDYIDIDRYSVDLRAASLVPIEVAKHTQAVPIGRRFGTPIIAVADPANTEAMESLRESVGRDFLAVVATPEQVGVYIDRIYDAGSAATEDLPDFGEDLGDARGPAATGLVDDASTAVEDDGTTGVAASGETGDENESRAFAIPLDVTKLPPLARVLVTDHRVTWADMARALNQSNDSGEALGQVLLNSHLVTEPQLVEAMSHDLGVDYVDLDTFEIDYNAVSYVPESTARHHAVLPVAVRDGVPVIAMANPNDVFALDDLRTVMGRSFTTVIAPRTQINLFIDQAYNRGKDAQAATRAAEGSPDIADEITEIQTSGVEDAPVVRYVNLIILQALNERASDIHIEPTATNLRVRFRIDGVLHDMTSAPKSIAQAVISRLKVIGDMNIAEHRLPQDGRTSIRMGDRDVDLRMATLPVSYGEKVVMRILDKSRALMSLEDLGFLPNMLERYRDLYSKPYGTILVTGPTGSGKSTTLYSTLMAINSPERNVVTVEDPIEYRMVSINQVQVNPRVGLTFSTALRAILRADPDVVLIGEIRDQETAFIAAEAALTGHLVLSTLHTNETAGTPMRLIEMGIEPYLVTSSLSGVLAQRLARRLCLHCREPYVADSAELEAAGWTESEMAMLSSDLKLYRAVGCQACANTGYRGRTALGEVMLMSEEIERLIINRASTDALQRTAVEQGMIRLRQDGVNKVAMGITTFEEVLRVVA